MSLRAFFLTALVAGVLAGVAGADTTVGFVTGGQQTLPSAGQPNGSGSIVVPFDLSSPPPVPEHRTYAQLVQLWQAAGRAYGVPWQVLGAINKIESNFGLNMGPSSAGAVGWMQFMPDTWMRWGVDANGDGLADPWNPDDAVYAAARYLAAAGGQADISRAVFAYNHAQWYVDEVLALARTLGSGAVPGGTDPTQTSAGPELVSQADSLRGQIGTARDKMAALETSVAAAQDRIDELGWKKLSVEQRAGNANLTDREFHRLEARVTQLAIAQDSARARLESAQQELDYAQSSLDELRKQAATVTFTSNGIEPGASALDSGAYVFPVGGGPTLVSAGWSHHDYPAVDIAAPEGSPVYALANSTVVAGWHTPNGPCGIGMEIRLVTGQVYVYCHLSYLQPDVVAGAGLAAGASVGLVGHTGHATGPHLHLQYSPATAWPQRQPWFEAFAGRAFSWQPGVPADVLTLSTQTGSASGSAPSVGFTP